MKYNIYNIFFIKIKYLLRGQLQRLIIPTKKITLNRKISLSKKYNADILFNADNLIMCIKIELKSNNLIKVTYILY